MYSFHKASYKPTMITFLLTVSLKFTIFNPSQITDFSVIIEKLKLLITDIFWDKVFHL